MTTAEVLHGLHHLVEKGWTQELDVDGNRRPFRSGLEVLRICGHLGGSDGLTGIRGVYAARAV